MQVVINDVDVTSCVQESTYNIDLKEEYKSWRDAAGYEHREAYRSKIKGTFDMVFISGYSLDYATVKSALDAATTDHVLTITLTVNNLNGASQTIYAYYRIDFKPMRRISNAVTYKRATITIEER